jgi:hypothetical protein
MRFEVIVRMYAGMVPHVWKQMRPDAFGLIQDAARHQRKLMWPQLHFGTQWLFDSIVSIVQLMNAQHARNDAVCVEPGGAFRHVIWRRTKLW